MGIPNCIMKNKKLGRRKKIVCVAVTDVEASDSSPSRPITTNTLTRSGRMGGGPFGAKSAFRIAMVVFRPALCQNMGVPYCIVKNKSHLGTVVRMKKTCVAITDVEANYSST